MQYRLLEKQARAAEALAVAGHTSRCSRDHCRQTQPDATQAVVVPKLLRLLKARQGPVDCITVGSFLGNV